MIYPFIIDVGIGISLVLFDVIAGLQQCSKASYNFIRKGNVMKVNFLFLYLLKFFGSCFLSFDETNESKFSLHHHSNFIYPVVKWKCIA